MEDNLMGMLLAGVCGAGIFFLGFYFRQRYKKLVQVCTAQTSGRVADVECRTDFTSDSGSGKRRKRRMYYPIFAYSADGRDIASTSSVGTSRPRFKKGESVSVFYDPNDVERHYVAEDKAASRSGFYFMAFGALLLVIAAMIPFFS